jgi:hypothetical protein
MEDCYFIGGPADKKTFLVNEKSEYFLVPTKILYQWNEAVYHEWWWVNNFGKKQRFFVFDGYNLEMASIEVRKRLGEPQA